MTHEVGWRIDIWTFRTLLGVMLALSGGACPGSVRAQGWIKTTAPHTNWSSIACSADGTKLVAAASGYLTSQGVPGPIFTSEDSGKTWTQTQAPLLGWMRVAAAADGKKIFASVFDERLEGQRLWSSTNGGSTWSAQGYLTNAYLLATSAN